MTVKNNYGTDVEIGHIESNPFPNNAANLKPCPFCGVDALVDRGFEHRITTTTDTYIAHYRITCRNGWCPVHPCTTWYDTEKEARDAWNFRPVKD